MCAIVGFIKWNGIKKDDLVVGMEMTQRLLHRGPDGTGTWHSHYAILGHARLSIIDVAGGAQPFVITSRAGFTLAIAYNGEVYNYREIRQQLTNLGHRFTTNCDTEVVLRAYEQWGANCVHHFVGMFAFAIWDEQQHLLFTARDPLGVKPLYYWLFAILCGWVFFGFGFCVGFR